MNPIRPRELTHRGTINAAALLVDAESLGDDEARRRVLAMWEPGARVEGTQSGMLVLWPAARLLRTESAPGMLLTRDRGAFLALPLTSEEFRTIDPPSHARVFARAGTVVVEPFDPLAVIDPAAWIDVSFDMIESESLGDLPPPPAIADSPAPALRTLFGDHVPPADASVARHLDQLRARANSPTTRPNFGTQVFAAVATALLAVLAPLRSLLASGSPYRSASPPSSSAISTPRSSRSNAMPMWRRMFGQWLARVVERLGLARLIGMRQAAYLRRMLDLFESQDWENALRHAIPLGGLTDGPPAPPSLRVPSPRASLDIRAARTPASSTIGGGVALADHLRKAYRTAFERLDAAGAHERAAFVLAELLQASEEAVAYLERKGNLRLAAEIAEARGLPPGLVVRQWFLAGDRVRAVEIARRSGGFFDAVQRLERSGHKDLANSLRRWWGDSLAASGNYAMAAEVVSEIDDARDDVTRWLDAARSTGGRMAARGLALKLSLSLEPSAEDRTALGEMLESDDPDAPLVRTTLAGALLARRTSSWSRVVARTLSRALLRDAAILGAETTAQIARRAVTFSGDAALRADLPPIQTFRRVSLATRAEPVILRVSADERGAIAIEDVAAAPRGGALVALGEAGVRWIGRDGHTVAVFDVPAHHLVVSDHGDRVLALARRGEAWRVSRIDLRSRRSDAWSEMMLGTWATGFDGDVWLVGRERELVALDACATEVRAVRRIDGLDSPVAHIARGATSFAFVVIDGDEVERWHFDQPSWVLRSRRATHQPALLWTDSQIAALSDGDTYVVLGTRPSSDESSDVGVPVLASNSAGSAAAISVGAEGSRAMQMQTAGRWVAAAVTSSSGVRVVLVDVPNVRLEIELHARKRVAMRLDDSSLWIGDDCGHVLRVSLESGEVQQRWLVL